MSRNRVCKNLNTKRHLQAHFGFRQPCFWEVKLKLQLLHSKLREGTVFFQTTMGCMGWKERLQIAGLFWNTRGTLEGFQDILPGAWSEYVFPSQTMTSTWKPKLKLLTTDVHSLEFGFWGHNSGWVSRESCGDQWGFVPNKSHMFGNSDLLRVLLADGCPDNSANAPLKLGPITFHLVSAL